MTVATTLAEYDSLSDPEKQQFHNAATLPPPTDGGLTAVWICVLAILGIVILGGATAVYFLQDHDKDVEFFTGIVGIALGAIVGLLSPSPNSD